MIARFLKELAAGLTAFAALREVHQGMRRPGTKLRRAGHRDRDWASVTVFLIACGTAYGMWASPTARHLIDRATPPAAGLPMSPWSVRVTSTDPDANSALQFYGDGTNDQDRVKIRIKNPDSVWTQKPVNVGAADMTIEFWMVGSTNQNAASAQTCGANNNAINGNMIIDRDRFGFGRKYWISLAGGVVLFGVADSTNTAGDQTIGCGGISAGDSIWHHVAVTRSATSGFMAVFVDGVLSDSITGPTGDIAYPDTGAISQTNCGGSPCDFSDPFIVLGAEKHDISSSFPSFTGAFDELRFSDTIRYAPAGFTAPTTAFTTDEWTMGLYHFNEGSDTIASDDSGQSVAAVWDTVEPPGQEGALRVGGTPSGPEWITSTAPTGN